MKILHGFALLKALNRELDAEPLARGAGFLYAQVKRDVARILEQLTWVLQGR